METAESVIKDALEALVYKAAEAPITADEGATCIRAMNRMMAAYDAEGIALGFTKVTSLSDSITIPDGALTGLIYGLAFEVSPQFAAPNVDMQKVMKLAELGKRAMRNIAIVAEPSSYPCTLPIGSGNQCSGTSSDRFYPCADESLTTETNANILAENDTEAQ